MVISNTDSITTNWIGYQLPVQLLITESNNS